MSRRGETAVKLFFYLVFSLSAAVFTWLNLRLNSGSESFSTSFIAGEASVLFFTVLALLGVNKGVESLASGFEELRANPGAFRINFYSEIVVLGFLLAIAVFDYLMVSAGYGLLAFFLGTFAFVLFLISLKMMEYVTKGALAIHLMQNVAPGRAVLRSLGVVHRYLALEVYRHLFKASGAVSGRLTDSLLASRGFPDSVISQGTEIALSYATFYVALGNSAAESVAESIQRTIDSPAETTFLSLGIAAVLLLSTVFLVIPIGVFFAVFLLTWDAFGGVAIVLGGLPFLAGLFFYIYLFTVPATAGEIALLRKLA